MTIQELFVRLLVFVQPVLPAVIWTIFITLAVTGVLSYLVRGLWINQKRFDWMGIFFELNKKDCVRLACSWQKFVLLLVFLVRFEKLTILSYLLILIPGLIYAVQIKKLHLLPGRLLWLFLELGGLLAANLVCGYFHDMKGGAAVILIYIFMSLFTILFGSYLLLTELGDLSKGRSVRIEEEKQEGAE